MFAVNPSNTVARFRVGEILLFQGKYEEALTALRSVPEVNPSLVGHQIVWALFNLGRKDEAAATLAQFLKDYQRTIVDSIRAWRRCLQRQQARNVWLRKNQFGINKGKGFGHFHHTAYHIACAYAHMNKPDQAMKWLEVASVDGFSCYSLFEKDANLNSLRQITVSSD